MAVGHVLLCCVYLGLFIKLLLTKVEWKNDYYRRDKYAAASNTRETGLVHVQGNSDLVGKTMTTLSKVTTRCVEKRCKFIGGYISYYSNSVKIFRLLQICGDVELNPGPNDVPDSSHDAHRNIRCLYTLMLEA